jgi:nicotinamidase-related amidase
MIAGLKTRLMDFFNPAAAGTDAPDSDTALMIIDVQKEFCSPLRWRGTLQTRAVARDIAHAAPAFRAAGIPVYAVYFVDAADIHMDAAREQMNRGTDHYKFHPAPQDRVILKNWNSAFRHGDVSARIHAAGHRNLLLCGFNLNSCVKETAIDGASAGFNIRLLRDLCGNDRENPEPYTSRAVTKMKENGIIFSDSATELSALRHARGVVP